MSFMSDRGRVALESYLSDVLGSTIAITDATGARDWQLFLWCLWP